MPELISLKSIDGNATGLMGNGGLTASFLGMTTPLFIAYLPIGLPLLLLAILYCKGFVGFLCFFAACLFYVGKRNWLVFMCGLSVLIGVIIFTVLNYGSFIDYRISAYLGTLDGIMYHFFNGWGLESFVYVVAQVVPENSIYFGQPFNTPNTILNHPHNEFLFGWWNFGLVFFVLSLYMVYQVIRQYSSKNELCFHILICSLVVMMFYFFTPPTVFLTVVVFGIYKNNVIKEIGNG